MVNIDPTKIQERLAAFKCIACGWPKMTTNQTGFNNQLCPYCRLKALKHMPHVRHTSELAVCQVCQTTRRYGWMS